MSLLFKRYYTSVLLPVKIIRDTLTVIDSGVLPDLTPALVLSLTRAFADVTTWLLREED